jgi:hypothetical protein
MAAVGLALHVYIFVEWLNDSAGDLLATATVAASLIVIAANLAFAAVAAAMIDPEG